MLTFWALDSAPAKRVGLVLIGCTLKMYYLRHKSCSVIEAVVDGKINRQKKRLAALQDLSLPAGAVGGSLSHGRRCDAASRQREHKTPQEAGREGGSQAQSRSLACSAGCSSSVRGRSVTTTAASEMALKEVVLFNGQKMPIIGLGTWQTDDADVSKALDAALEAGYRLINTAYLYQNEAAIGRTLKKWFDSGRMKREDLFIVTKLPLIGNNAERVEKYLKRSLTSLQLKYVDLYLIHHPIGLLEKGEMIWPTNDEGKLMIDYETDHLNLWKAMEAQVDAGRARNIGLSNFNSRQIKRIVKNSRIQPANLQIELHVYFQQRELAAFCSALDITVCAYAPLGSPGLIEFLKSKGADISDIHTISPVSDPVVQKIANKYNKTPAQILLRHIIERKIVVIPKSIHSNRIRENFNIFDFKLGEKDIQELNALDKGSIARMFSDRAAPSFLGHPENPFADPY